MMRFLAFLLLAISVVPAGAAPPDPEHPGPYHQWFESQVVPQGDPSAGSSCCAESDGHIIEEEDWRIAQHRYEVHVGDAWIPVPDTRVLPNSRNPTGKPVVWYLPTVPTAAEPAGIHIFCFAPGTES